MKSSSDSSQKGMFRVDRAYFLGEPNNDDHPGVSTNIFAAPEYKKFGAIDRSQSKAGIVTDFNEFDDAQLHSAYVDRVEEDNVMVLLKQAVHYVWRQETPFVALCDYNTLVLLYMPKQKDSHGGPYTYMTIVRGESKEMRKAYLGFLLAARSRAQGNKDWRLSQARQDLFLEAEQWWQQSASSTPQRNPGRSGRNDNPRHDTPSSQGSDVSMTGVQRGRGDHIILLILFLAKDLHNIPNKDCRNVEADFNVHDFERQLSLNKELELLLHGELYIQNQRTIRFEETK
ncbi:hypothetical protein J7T55_005747 [Diaporthe amygdali]|uniref:uncharacterized protein n=1 Tax=Phomopsis amygdali TaxID=1214568 RepID=UPI0022FE6315|nr:uncharacterized protein J7T55_005747 [Diaporthe amygdali]KAJ0124409.1 hypothetical protein J7T55_005747 [Diaporthe amygdali]